MPYIYGKLWHLAIIWAIRKAFQCILQGVKFLLANHTRLSPTSENESYVQLCQRQTALMVCILQFFGLAWNILCFCLGQSMYKHRLFLLPCCSFEYRPLHNFFSFLELKQGICVMIFDWSNQILALLQLKCIL